VILYHKRAVCVKQAAFCVEHADHAAQRAQAFGSPRRLTVPNLWAA